MSKNKVSIVIACYQSHEIVRRQLLHLGRFPAEVIIVDDNSTPPIPGAKLRTENKLAWTQGLARNAGARVAQGDYIFFTDIDHILSKESIDDALEFEGNKMIFRRQIAVLDEDGEVTQDPAILKDWGWKGGKLDASVHGNTFVIQKGIFWWLGGYDEKVCKVGYHPVSRKGDDCYFNAKWNRAFKGQKPAVGHDIGMFPIGRFHKDGNLNPKGLFHDLSQTKREAFYK
jgi:glycosyltransferase involved in cell wall biosynthesis